LQIPVGGSRVAASNQPFIRNKRLRRPHEGFPDLGRQGSTGDSIHGRMVVVANPDTDDKLITKADEPSIAVVLACAGLARREAGNGCGTPRAPIDHSLQELDHFLPMSHGCLRPDWGPKGSHWTSRRPEGCDAPWLNSGSAIKYRCVSAREIEQADFDCAKRQAGNRSELRIDSEIVSGSNDLIQSNVQGEPYSAGIDRMDEAVG
jgi:hypothetical protein